MPMFNVQQKNKQIEHAIVSNFAMDCVDVDAVDPAAFAHNDVINAGNSQLGCTKAEG